MAIPIKLQVFEGPMDLLMHLIEKNKIDIYDIPIAVITDQYLDYMRQMEHEDMNVASEFLVMAATLLDIKSRMLLPRDEKEEDDEGDPRDELVQRLLEYKLYKYMSEELRERSRQAGISYYRQQDLPEEVRAYVPPVDYKELIGDRTTRTLQAIFEDVMRRRKSRVDPVRSGFGEIHREEISAADKELFVRAYLKNHPHADFRELLESRHSKDEVIVTFLVILELMKAQKIRITQDEAFGKITIDAAGEDAGEAEEHGQETPDEAAETGIDGHEYEIPDNMMLNNKDAAPETADRAVETAMDRNERENQDEAAETAPAEDTGPGAAAGEGTEKKTAGGRLYHSGLAKANSVNLRRSTGITVICREIVTAQRRLGMSGALAYNKAVQKLRNSRIWHRKRRIHGISAQ